MNTNETSQEQAQDDIDLLQLFGILIDYRKLIVLITFAFSLLGIGYALLATPIYQASAMVQIEAKKSGITGIEGMDELFNTSSQAVTEIEIIKSRWVIGKAVDNLKLTTSVTPKRFPIIGNTLARRFTPTNNQEVAAPLFGLNQYDWGGSALTVFELKTSDSLQNQALTLTAKSNNQYTVHHNSSLLAECETGKLCEKNGISLLVQAIKANEGTEFTVKELPRFDTILNIQSEIQAAERGKQSGMIGLQFQHSQAAFAKTLLNEVANLYVQQNVERMSAEAANSLQFLREQLPTLRKEMETAEQKLNRFQIGAKSADISIETQSVLDQMVTIDTNLSELNLKQLEMDKRFTPSHPLYQTLRNQIATLENNKKSLEEKVKNLPQTQQELFRLQRDLQVSSEIYTLLQQKAQELDIARASTVGNARIIDSADVDIGKPVAPKRSLIVVISTLLGGIIAVVIAFIHNLLHRGVENPAEIEAMNLPVYANIPFSALQAEQKENGHITLLSKEYPSDISIESIRSLHASLHFALLEASNNIVMISGPSPEVGKSFVAANLAVVMAESGKKVLLIDADMRRGHLHKYFGSTTTHAGLSSVLAKQNPFEQAVKHTSITHLDLLERGPIPPNPSELLLSQQFEQIISAISQSYDIVLIDTPPILAVADALAVSKIAGASFIVTRFGKNPASEIRATIKRFENNGVQLKGAVMNATLKKFTSNYGYQKYHYNYKYYEYKSDKE